MENEKETVGKRIERMQRKVDGLPNSEMMLEVAKKLRMEKEKEKELQVGPIYTFQDLCPKVHVVSNPPCIQGKLYQSKSCLLYTSDAADE